MRSNRLIRKEADNDIAILGPFINNVDKARVHNIGNHAEIDFLYHLLYVNILFCVLEITFIIYFIPLEFFQFKDIHWSNPLRNIK